MAGVNESFTIKLTNLPHNLFLENFLKYGEFLECEVVDFIIPKYNGATIEYKLYE